MVSSLPRLYRDSLTQKGVSGASIFTLTLTPAPTQASSLPPPPTPLPVCVGGWILMVGKS